MKIIKPSLKRSLFSSRYLIHITVTVILSIMSIEILKAFEKAALLFPQNVIDAFKSGDNYNIGILSLPSLNAADNTSCDNIITGILSGSFFIFLIVFLITSFIGSEKKGGYMLFAITKGAKRSKLYTKYIITSVISLFPLIITCQIGVIFSLLINGIAKIQNIKRVFVIVGIQILIIIAIGICVTVVSFLAKKASLVCLCAVVIVPLLPNYLSVFTNRKIDITNYLLLSCLIESASMNETELTLGINVAVLTSALI